MRRRPGGFSQRLTSEPSGPLLSADSTHAHHSNGCGKSNGSSGAPAVGVLVELEGLQQAPELNGQVGVVRSVDSGCCEVELIKEDGSIHTVRIGFGNLLPLADPDAAHEDSSGDYLDAGASSSAHASVANALPQQQVTLRSAFEPPSSTQPANARMLDPRTSTPLEPSSVPAAATAGATATKTDRTHAHHSNSHGKSNNGGAFAVGVLVELDGLQQAPELNGQVGVIRSVDGGRCEVELIKEDGSLHSKRVRFGNLLPLTDPDEVREDSSVQEAQVVALSQAVQRCDLFQVQALLRDKADPNAQSLQGPQRGEVTSLLLEATRAAANCNENSSLGSRGGPQHLNLVALLLGYSADPSPVLTTDLQRSALVSPAPDALLLCRIFKNREVTSDEERAALGNLEPGALAQARRRLRLPGPFALGGEAPARCLQSDQASSQELSATKDHSVSVHSVDRLRPLLVLRPLTGQPTAAVVLLHGLFQSGLMMESLARDLSPGFPHAVFLMPTAPTRDTWNVGPSWFDHIRRQHTSKHLDEARSEVLALLSFQDQHWQIPPEHVVLCGFSMGGTVAAWTALQVPRRLAGLVLLGSEGLRMNSEELEEALFSEWWTGAEGLPVLQCHGHDDQLCPLSVATDSSEALRELGCKVDLLTFAGVGHTLSPTMIEQIGDWMSQQIPQ
ncbi:unnamed protein product [Polarella glacialis]|uniref:Phospholipase/carboxylesterase/thioesterase domain-containing protein n=1 Tax=Polarella glacialis TaxID=89957 RepID=A0A813IKB2_POLGL|nr:unnamed protein product [Polarella glacialis]